MTVSSEVKRKDYAGNGSTTNFATVFRFLQNSDVKVILTVDATAVETVQVLDTDYTLVGAGLDAGGAVTMIVAPPSGATLTVKRDVSLTQETDYIENDDFPAESHEDALDKLTMITQQIQEELDRSLKLSESGSSTGLTLPDPSDGLFLQWDSADNLVNVDILLQGALAVSDFAKTYLDDLTATATRATLGLTIGTDVAPNASPVLTGIPAAPTAAPGTNTTQLGTTAFTTEAISAIPLASNIAGLLPSNAADADHDITISVGSASDSATAKQLALSSDITKQLDAAFVEGNDAGGLFSGTIDADTTYHLFIIEKDSDGSIDAGFDTSLTAANIPTGFTAFRRIASFITDSSSNIIGFSAVESNGGGLIHTYDDRIQDVNDTTPGTARVTFTATVPLDIQFLARLAVILVETATAEIIITETTQTDVAPTSTTNDLRTTSSGSQATTNMERMTSTLGQMNFRSSDATVSAFAISIIGYYDFRR